jgi:hypothetical protein
MKTNFLKLLFALLMIASSCGKKSNEQAGHHSEVTETGGNEALYQEVMKVHDEAMMKMNDIYTLKQSLNSKLEDSTRMDEGKKTEIKSTIGKLDSASEDMMVWMRAFSPIPDSLGEEKAREYLETEMEKVKRVRENIVEALDKGKALK